MRNLCIAGPLVLGLVILVLSVPERGAERYLVTGSSTVAPILQAAAERLQQSEADWVIDVQTGGSGRGIADARAGQSNAGMASRDLTPEESVGLTVQPLAYDGVALIAHASNPTVGLSRDQVVGIYKKELRTWAAVGGGGGEILVVNKAEGRATLAVFLEHFGLKNSEISSDVVIGDNAQGLRLVASDPAAIAYVSIGEGLSAIARGETIRLLALDGVVPSLKTVADGTFPLRRTLYLLLPGELGARDLRLRDFLMGAEGRSILAGLGFVPFSATD